MFGARVVCAGPAVKSAVAAAGRTTCPVNHAAAARHWPRWRGGSALGAHEIAAETLSLARASAVRLAGAADAGGVAGWPSGEVLLIKKAAAAAAEAAVSAARAGGAALALLPVLCARPPNAAVSCMLTGV